MMRWQYLPAWVLYTSVFTITLPLMIRYRLTPGHLILANPSLPWGGMEIDSKFEIMERFRGLDAFLEQVLLPVSDSIEANLARAEALIRSGQLSLPVIAKPDRGCVGFGVRLVHNLSDLRTILELTPVDYLLQQRAESPEEFGVFFTKLPGDVRGKVTGLTHKQIPSVTGNGSDTLHQLVEQDCRFEANRKAIFRHAKDLDRIPPRGEQVPLLVQASHTYGAWFRDVSNQGTPALIEWVNAFMAHDPQFCHGRLDVRAPSLPSLLRGENISVIEVNGCLSEPIHAYDDAHSLCFGMLAFYRAYRDAYRAAAANRGRQRVPLREMLKAYSQFYRMKRQVMQHIG